MSCYHPIAGFPDYTVPRTEKGRFVYKLSGKYEPKLKLLDKNVIAIPCGKCIGCRLDYSRAWADRMMLELDHTKKGIFITLTYNDEHIPRSPISSDGEYYGDSDEENYGGVYSLRKRDLQLFFKRLRKKYPDKELRFYAAGEYGTESDRPHYHIVLFGLSLDDLSNKRIVHKNKLKQPVYTAKEIEEAWSILKKAEVSETYKDKRGRLRERKKKILYYDSIGYVSIGEVSWESCAYVSRYVQKKCFGGKLYLQELYECEPEFSVMSRRPGIAGYYLIDHPDALDLTEYFVPGKEDSIRVPRFFIDKLDNEKSGLYNPELYDKIRSERKKFATDKILLELQNTDDEYSTYLEKKEEKKLRSSSVLKRNRV